MYDTYHFFERIMDGKMVFVDREANVKELMLWVRGTAGQ
jgi:hypothetical protein